MRLKYNQPHHGMGPQGKDRARKPLISGHLPQRVTSGNQDRHGYQDSPARRNGRHTGHLGKSSDTRIRSGHEGNSKGSPPPGVGKGKGVEGTLNSHLGDAGRGGKGKIGRGDMHKGQNKALSESITHDAFMRLGAD